MVFSRHSAEIALRAGALFVTLAALAWTLSQMHWYVTSALLAAAAIFETYLLARRSAATSRELARFLDALAFDDVAQSFSGLKRDAAFRELGEAMARVMEQLRGSRVEREEQARYLQALIAHVPVALMARDAEGRVQLLNPAARRLFETPVAHMDDLARFGDGFAAGLAQIAAGGNALLRMERAGNVLHLKAAATALALRGREETIVSLQNIANELNAQELMAWQTVIRTMAHEIMNSLTPISSLSATAHGLVESVRSGLPPNGRNRPALDDAADALETVTRRSEGLSHFVETHRRLTQRLVARPEPLSIARVFARLERLLAGDFAAHAIAFTSAIVPESLELVADPELLDQALINLLRNAMDAVKGRPEARIALSANRDADGRVAIAVGDNGPGIDPELREKVFVPFYTTKRNGTGVGLTLVCQIAAVHGATALVSDTPGGGATVSLLF